MKEGLHLEGLGKLEKEVGKGLVRECETGPRHPEQRGERLEGGLGGSSRGVS